MRVVARAARLDAGRIDGLLELVGLSNAAGRRVGGYSLGMRQRLGIATALLGDPGVLVLDEPSNRLDPEGVAWVRQLLRAYADEGRTVVVSSHLLAEVAQVVDRVVIIRAGTLITETAIADLADHAVAARVDQPSLFSAALADAGIEHAQQADGSYTITGLEPLEVGALAQRAGVAVIELSRRPPGQALEELFLAATGGAP